MPAFFFISTKAEVMFSKSLAGITRGAASVRIRRGLTYKSESASGRLASLAAASWAFVFDANAKATKSKTSSTAAHFLVWGKLLITNCSPSRTKLIVYSHKPSIARHWERRHPCLHTSRKRLLDNKKCLIEPKQAGMPALPAYLPQEAPRQ